MIKSHHDNDLTNTENRQLLAIPLPITSMADLIARGVGSVNPEVIQEAFEKATNTKARAGQEKPIAYVPGVGINPSLAVFINEHLTCFNENYLEALKNEQVPELSLVSIVELPSIKHGYPNCDVVCALSHGTVEQGESPQDTAWRYVSLSLSLSGSLILSCSLTHPSYHLSAIFAPHM